MKEVSITFCMAKVNRQLSQQSLHTYIHTSLLSVCFLPPVWAKTLLLQYKPVSVNGVMSCTNERIKPLHIKKFIDRFTFKCLIMYLGYVVSFSK